MERLLFWWGFFHHLQLEKTTLENFLVPQRRDGGGGDLEAGAAVTRGHQAATGGCSSSASWCGKDIDVLWSVFLPEREIFPAENEEAHPCDLFVI